MNCLYRIEIFFEVIHKCRFMLQWLNNSRGRLCRVPGINEWWGARSARGSFLLAGSTTVLPVVSDVELAGAVLGDRIEADHSSIAGEAGVEVTAEIGTQILTNEEAAKALALVGGGVEEEKLFFFGVGVVAVRDDPLGVGRVAAVAIALEKVWADGSEVLLAVCEDEVPHFAGVVAEGGEDLAAVLPIEVRDAATVGNSFADVAAIEVGAKHGGLKAAFLEAARKDEETLVVSGEDGVVEKHRARGELGVAVLEAAEGFGDAQDDFCFTRGEIHEEGAVVFGVKAGA